MNNDKSRIEISLEYYSRWKPRKPRKQRLEQYPTPTSIAAHMVWTAYMKNKILDKTVLDLGCGNGVLVTASLIAGARRGICVDIDDEVLEEAIRILNERYHSLIYRVVFIQGDALVIEFSNTDTVVMNPPFGVVRSNRGLDLGFLRSALRSARYVFSIHKYSEGLEQRIKEISERGSARVDWFEVLYLEIPMIYPRHRRRIHRVKAVFIGLESRVV